jgi:glyoxylase-like metal-dependent hydrolase (beta-lactamase superfamily II)
VFDRDLEKVADGVYLAFRPEPLRNYVEGNSVIIVNKTDVVVVDTGGSPASARSIISHIKKLTPNPVRYVVNTHIHRDHRFGNQEFVKAFPGVEIIAHPSVRATILATNPKYLEDLVKRTNGPQTSAEKEIDRLRREDPNGNRAVIAHLSRLLESDILDIRREYRTVVNTPPSITVSDKLVLHSGDRTIEIAYLGHGDTDGDLIVYLPREKIVCTGDMVVHPFPYGYTEKPVEWLATLRRLESLDFEYLVPGHGSVQRHKEYLRDLTAMLAAMQATIARGIADGSPLEQVKAKVDLAGFDSKWVGADPVYRYYFRQYFVDPAIERAFRQLSPK